MILSCPSCPKTYDVPAAALPPGGREVECSACGTVWFERGAMAAAVAAGARGADVAGWDVIDAEFEAVEPSGSRPERPKPEAASPDAEPAPSPAREQQTALAVAYLPPDAVTPERQTESDAAREAARLLAGAARARLRSSRDRALTLAGIGLGTLIHLTGRFRRTSAAPQPVTPGDAAARETRARMRARAVNALTPARALAWLLWASVLGTAVFAVTTKRDAVEAVFPPAANLYALISPPDAPRGLTVRAELRAYAVSSQGPAVMVSGLVANEGASAFVPLVTLTAETGEGREAQVLPLPRVALPPGGERPFAVRALVPEGATALAVSVAPGEPGQAEGFTVQGIGSGWDASNGHAGPPSLGRAPGGAEGAAPR